MKDSIRIRIHPAGAVMLAAAFVFYPSSDVLAAVAALFWHECAHVIAMRLCGCKSGVIELTPFGGMADYGSYEKLQPIKQAICAGAGVAASGTAFLLLHTFHGVSQLMDALEKMNLSLMFVNCLPVWPLDGARVLTALASLVGKERAIRKLLSILAHFVGILLCALGLYGAWLGWINPTLLMCGPYLCYASVQGNAAYHIRKMTSGDHEKSDFEILAAQLSVCLAGNEERVLRRLLGRRERGKYQIVFVIDPVSGKIKKAISEQEMLEDIVGSET